MAYNDSLSKCLSGRQVERKKFAVQASYGGVIMCLDFICFLSLARFDNWLSWLAVHELHNAVY